MPKPPNQSPAQHAWRVGLLERSAAKYTMNRLMKTAGWMDIARREAGVATFAATSSNPRIEEYHRVVSTRSWDDKVSWCSSFLNWCMLKAGLPGTGSALARSWLDWGVPLANARAGCVVVLWQESPDSWKGHVGLFLREEDGHIFLWGGNQLGGVREHFYPIDRVIGYRWPAEASLAAQPMLSTHGRPVTFGKK